MSGHPDTVEGLAGYFGKVPVRGDFLSNGLPRDFIAPWDDWISSALASSRQQIGEAWLEFFLTSPVWYFTLSPAICGDRAWTGVVMPSVDSVGRYFPLVVAAPIGQGLGIAAMLEAAKPWYTQAEQLARSCLDEDFDLAAFDSAVRALGSPRGASDPSADGAPQEDIERLENAWRLSMPSPDDLAAAYPQLLQGLLDQVCFAHSQWWTEGSSYVAPTYLFCQGLPPPAGFAAMLDGEWRRWGWEDKHFFTPDDSPAA